MDSPQTVHVNHEHRPRRSPSIAKLAAALAKAQGEMENAEKDTKGNYGKYATLASTWNAIRKPLSNNEIAVYQRPLVIGGHIMMCTMLMHSSGEFLDDSELEMIFDKSGGRLSPMQAMGSAVTYARRYTLQGAAGIAPADDDDGEGAGRPQPQREPPRRPPPLKSDSTPQTAKDTSPAGDDLLATLNMACGDKFIGSDKIAYLIRKGFGMDPQGQLPVWVVRDILNTLSKPDCTDATILARAEILKQARVARGMDDDVLKKSPEEIAQEEFNKAMSGDDKEPTHPGHQVSKEPIDKSFREYVIPNGKFKGAKMVDVGLLECRKYLDFMEASAKKEKKTLSGWAQEFKFHYEHFAAALSRGETA